MKAVTYGVVGMLCQREFMMEPTSPLEGEVIEGLALVVEEGLAKRRPHFYVPKDEMLRLRIIEKLAKSITPVCERTRLEENSVIVCQPDDPPEEICWNCKLMALLGIKRWPRE